MGRIRVGVHVMNVFRPNAHHVIGDLNHRREWAYKVVSVAERSQRTGRKMQGRRRAIAPFDLFSPPRRGVMIGERSKIETPMRDVHRCRLGGGAT